MSMTKNQPKSKFVHVNGRNYIIHPKEHPKILSLYKKGWTLEKIGEKYGVSLGGISQILKKNGVRGRQRTYAINENYFEKLDTPEKCYCFGFILADGSLNLRNGKSGRARHCTLAIQIMHKDAAILKYIRSQIFPNDDKPLYTKPAKEFYFKDQLCHRQEAKTLEVHNHKICKDLESHGCIENKTNNFETMTIPDHFFDFMRGLFDGDGCLYITNKKCKRWGVNMSFALHEKMCVILKDELSKYDIFCHIQDHNSSPQIKYLCITQKESLKKIIGLMYQKQGFCLQRKKRKADALITKYSAE